MVIVALHSVIYFINYQHLVNKYHQLRGSRGSFYQRALGYYPLVTSDGKFCYYYLVISYGKPSNQFSTLSRAFGLLQVIVLVLRSQGKSSVYLILNLAALTLACLLICKADLFSIQISFFIYFYCFFFMSLTIFSCLLIFQLFIRASISIVFQCWTALQVWSWCIFILDYICFKGDSYDILDQFAYLVIGSTLGFIKSQSIFLNFSINYCFLIIRCFIFNQSALLRLLLDLSLSLSECLFNDKSFSLAISVINTSFYWISLCGTTTTEGVYVSLLYSLEYVVEALFLIASKALLKNVPTLMTSCLLLLGFIF